MRVDAIVFAVEDRDYAVDVAEVKEVVGLQQITPVPLAPPVVVGAVELAGRILPLIDVALLLERRAQQRASSASGLRLVAGRYELLLLAAEVRGVRSFEVESATLEGSCGQLARTIETAAGRVELLSSQRVAEAMERLFERVQDAGV